MKVITKKYDVFLPVLLICINVDEIIVNPGNYILSKPVSDLIKMTMGVLLYTMKLYTPHFKLK